MLNCERKTVQKTTLVHDKIIIREEGKISERRMIR
jgi:hypothetical protein